MRKTGLSDPQVLSKVALKLLSMEVMAGRKDYALANALLALARDRRCFKGWIASKNGTNPLLRETMT
ncbi:hypothetical protein CR513_09621, partial [Mucuna pruriens]